MRDEHIPIANGDDQADEIRRIRTMKDRQIDTTDIPPVIDWTKAIVGKFYRPVKSPVTQPEPESRPSVKD